MLIINFKGMAETKLPYTGDQHTTPRCYLKYFSKDNQFIYRKFKKPFINKEAVEKELKTGAPLSKATVIKDFYTVNDCNEPMVVEKLVYEREIEQYYPKIYDLLIDPTRKDFEPMDRIRMLMFFLSLHCRTPKQFEIFFNVVPQKFHFEMDKIKEDYKAAHLKDVLTNFIGTHEFKRVEVARITDTSEFITSDNPVLIIGRDNRLKNHLFREQFNRDNKIFVPIDPKHCFILTHCLDKDGIDAHGKVFYNKIERIDVDITFAQTINWHMLESAHKYFYGSEKYMNAYFSTFILEDGSKV